MGYEGTDIGEAREALAFWSGRAERLPWHRRAARREARELAARWRGRLIAAHLQRWRLGRFEAMLAPLLDTRGRSVPRHAGRIAWRSVKRTPVGRALVIATTAFAVAGVMSMALLTLLLVQLAG